MAEGFEGTSEASLKNLYGLAPFGQKFDDIEPGPIGYFKDQWNKFFEHPLDTAIGGVKDFFAIE